MCAGFPSSYCPLLDRIQQVEQPVLCCPCCMPACLAAWACCPFIAAVQCSWLCVVFQVCHVGWCAKASLAPILTDLPTPVQFFFSIYTYCTSISIVPGFRSIATMQKLQIDWHIYVGCPHSPRASVLAPLLPLAVRFLSLPSLQLPARGVCQDRSQTGLSTPSSVTAVTPDCVFVSFRYGRSWLPASAGTGPSLGRTPQ